MEEQNVDQSILANDIASKIRYEFRDHFLVKPLDPIMVTKTFTRPNPTNNKEGEAKGEADGIAAIDYDDVITETKEVESDFTKGIVIKIPTSVTADPNVSNTINIGDVVVFRQGAGYSFDLLKDSRLVRFYDIVAVEK